MKILFVAGRWDPSDHNLASGMSYQISQALIRKGADVEIVGPFQYGFSLPERVLMRIHRYFFKTRLFKYPIHYFFKSAYHVSRAINQVNPDLIVTKYSAPLALVKTDKPLLYLTDSSVKWVRANWPIHAYLTYLTMSAWESWVIRRSARIVTYSEANAKVLREQYRVPAGKLVVLPIPASIPSSVIIADVDVTKALSPVKLLLVGREYHRKGVDIAIKIVEKLNAQGVKAKLRIVGLEGTDTTSTRFMGLYNKTIPDELEGYVANYQWSNFLLHPARFEAAGIVPAEAAAFGVPTLTHDAGGLATTVADGVSGVVFPKDSPAEVYVSKIVELINDPAAIPQLVKTTKTRYEQELNWLVTGDRIYQIAEEIIGG